MTTPTGSPSRAGAPLRAASELLQLFLTSNRAFALSNDSLRNLVTEFAARLTAAGSDERALAMLRAWRGQVETARDTALREAQSLRFADGVQIPLLTEDDAARVIRACLPPAPKYP